MCPRGLSVKTSDGRGNNYMRLKLLTQNIPRLAFYFSPVSINRTERHCGCRWRDSYSFYWHYSCSLGAQWEAQEYEKYIQCESIYDETQIGTKTSPVLYSWWSIRSLADEIKSVLSAISSGFAGPLVYRCEASGELKKRVNQCALIWSFNLSHLVFSSSRSDGADRMSVFTTCDNEPQRTSSAGPISDQMWGLMFGQANTQRKKISWIKKN